MSDEKVLTVKQVAAELETTPNWVRKMIRAGEIKASNVGTEKRPRYRVRRTVLSSFIESRTVVGIEEG